MMWFKDNNIVPFLLTFLPVLLYVWISYFYSPQKTIIWKTAFLYFMMGVLSTIALTCFHYIFPRWANDRSNIFIYSMIQVAMVEEGVKYLFYRVSLSYQGTDRYVHSYGRMFYYMSVAAGFAVAENIIYAKAYGYDVLYMRSITAVIIHVTCGITVGYFLAFNRKDLTFIGFIFATFVHGSYDYLLFRYKDQALPMVAIVILYCSILSFILSHKVSSRTY